jgi:hypothetical protein
MLEPIEDHLRDGEPLPDGSQLVIRGWPLNPEGLMRNAAAASERYSLGGSPLVAVSTEATIEGWPLERILSGRRLRTRKSYAAVPVGRVLEAGYTLLATFNAPHYDVVWPSYSEEQAARLALLFDPVIRNPYYEGRSR